MNNEQSNIDQTMANKNWLRKLIQIATWLTYPFLFLSATMPLGIAFTVAFLSEFSIENRTQELISVTPVGTVGEQGFRSSLPIVTNEHFPLPATKRGGFEISPGETITLLYDMDDINFSEIVVQNSDGQQRQIVVNPNPTEGQYHAPRQRHYVIDDFEKLAEVPDKVSDAALAAQVPINFGLIMLSFIVLPWFAYFGLAWLDRKIQSIE